MADPDLVAAFNENNAPFARMIGVRFTHVARDRIEAELEVTPAHCTVPATLHGGAIMAFADNLGGVGAFLNMPEGARTTTIESKTNFLRPIPVGETAKAVTTPIKLGRTAQVWKTEVFDGEGRLAAIVMQTQLILAARGQNGAF
ncbi:MAG TPA: PaaI family thioesterase [Parvularculaceae bacterium]|nr:PaaI family thioesterase [Parvularculaceae bacterium]